MQRASLRLRAQRARRSVSFLAITLQWARLCFSALWMPSTQTQSVFFRRLKIQPCFASGYFFVSCTWLRAYK